MKRADNDAARLTGARRGRGGVLGAAGLSLCALLLGCRREDWRTCSLPLPEGVGREVAVAELRALDRQTPPEIAVEAGVLAIRYNSLRVSPQNFRYTLGRLAAEAEPRK